MSTPAILKVLQPGLCTLVVDRGRPHFRSLGVPIGGAADCAALAIGNALVGNPPDAAALEVALAGPTLTANTELASVLFGAPFAVFTDRRPLTAGKTFTLQPGEVLHIGGTPRGARAYLCVRGGLQTPIILGSRSSLGPLQTGAELPCLSGAIGSHFLTADEPAASPSLRRRAGPVKLFALPGAQAEWFPPDRFYGEAYTVAAASNRMGLRLVGEPLPVPPRPMLSEPVGPGTVQVTRDGQCIVLGVDGQTIGGYPKIAHICGWQLGVLGQLRSGDRLAFRRVRLERAERMYRRLSAALFTEVKRVRAAGPTVS
jgi:antagonist of KipI